MALRDIRTGHVLAIRACAEALRDGRLVLVERKATDSTLIHISGVCPEHESAACVETYYAARDMARWSLWDFRSWRSRTRLRIGGAR